LIELSRTHRVFVGIKMDGSLRRQLHAIQGPDSRYVSTEDATFLTICRFGDQEYVGKLVQERLTTERVEDVRRNVLSILHRLCPETRLPNDMEIHVYEPAPEAP
jgi:hypothetical protein